MKCSRNSLRLYAVTNGELTEEADLTAALSGGVTMVQLREKALSDSLFLDKAKRFQKICASFSVPLIINDRADIAAASDADGVHIGQSDGTIEEARRLIGPDRILGVSVHTPEEALSACRLGADYLGVGALFPTATKLDAEIVSLDTLREICRISPVPVVGIGGIGLNNAELLAGTGIAGIAVISAVFSQPDIRLAAEKLALLRY